MDFPYGETLTVQVVTGAPNAYGDATEATASQAWGPCAIAPRSSQESVDSRSPAVITGITVYGPPREFTSRDRVVIASGTYAGTWAVDGIPGDWLSPFTGWHPGVEVALKRATEA